MNFEKAYKSLVAKIKNAHLYAQTDSTKSVLEDILPSLRESEDEMTRKEIINYLDFAESHNLLRAADYEKKKGWLAYLEKQKELPFVKDVMLGYPGLYFYDGERMHFRGPAMEETQKEQKPAERDSEDVFDKIDNSFRKGREVGFREGVESVKPAEWSEEDERMWKSALWHIKNSCGNGGKNSGEFEVYQWFENRVKSLRPQPHWKPSEEQMAALDRAIPVCMGVAGNDGYSPLISLYEQLKKL